MTTQNIAFIGNHRLPDDLAHQLKLGGFQSRTFDTLAACGREIEKQKIEVIILDPGRLTELALGRIQRLPVGPSFVLLLRNSESQAPEIGEGCNAVLLDSAADGRTWLFTIGQAASDFRRRRRLFSLRRHFAQKPNLHPHPAIDLLANLMHRLAITVSLPGLLRALEPLVQAIPFHQLLIASHSETGPNQAFVWAQNEEMQNRTIGSDLAGLINTTSLHKADLVRPESEIGRTLHPLLNHPWQSALLMSFEAALLLDGSSRTNRFVVFFVRNNLDVFSEHERWLLEFAYPPIATTLERIAHSHFLNAKIVDWRTTFDAISEPIAIVDRKFKILRANQAFAGAVGSNTRAIAGLACYTVFARRRSPCENCPLIVKTQTKSDSAVPNVKNLRGERFEVWSYDLKESKTDFSVHFYRNVSKRSQLTAALFQSEKMAALGKLILSIAHEINNPLAGLLAKTQLAIQDEAAPPAIREDLQEILSAAQRARQITNGLLGFGGELIERDILMLDAIQSCLKFAKVALRNVRVDLNVQDSLRLKGATAGLFQQIMFNLITNGAHAMPQGGALSIRAKQENEFYTIQIRDGGKGMSKDRVARIFEPFITEKQRGSGTGLGLFIVRSLVAKLSGEIQVESALGKGTCFHIRFPKTIFVEDLRAGNSDCR